MIREKVEKVIDVCRHYPSGDNCLQFSGKIISDSEIEIVYNKEVAVHPFNPSGIADYISFGSLLEIIKIACYQNGLQMYVEPSENKLSANIKFKEHEYSALSFEKNLFDSIPNRTANRFPYESTPIQSEHINKIINSTLGCKQVKAKLFTNINKDLKTALIQGEAVLWKWPEAFQHFVAQVNFSEAEMNNKLRGINSKGLGVKKIDEFMLKNLKKIKHMAPTFSKLGWHVNGVNNGRRLINNSGGILLFSVEEFNKDAIIDVGRAMIRAWLQCDSLEIQAQPMAGSVLSFAALEGGLQFDFPLPEKVLTKHLEYYQVIKQEFGLADELPVFVLRLGYGKRLSENQLTLKKHFLDN